MSLECTSSRGSFKRARTMKRSREWEPRRYRKFVSWQTRSEPRKFRLNSWPHAQTSFLNPCHRTRQSRLCTRRCGIQRPDTRKSGESCGLARVSNWRWTRWRSVPSFQKPQALSYRVVLLPPPFFFFFQFTPVSFCWIFCSFCRFGVSIFFAFPLFYRTMVKRECQTSQERGEGCKSHHGSSGVERGQRRSKRRKEPTTRKTRAQPRLLTSRDRPEKDRARRSERDATSPTISAEKNVQTLVRKKNPGRLV